MSRLRDGPFILESLGSELGHFPLLQAIGASRWTPHFRCVRLKTEPNTPYFWGVLDQILVPSLILDVNKRRPRSTPSPSGCWGSLTVGLSYSF